MLELTIVFGILTVAASAVVWGAGWLLDAGARRVGVPVLQGDAADHRSTWIITLIVLAGARFVLPFLLRSTGCLTHPVNSGDRADLALLAIFAGITLAAVLSERLRRWPSGEAVGIYCVVCGVVIAMSIASPLLNGCGPG